MRGPAALRGVASLHRRESAHPQRPPGARTSHSVNPETKLAVVLVLVLFAGLTLIAVGLGWGGKLSILGLGIALLG